MAQVMAVVLGTAVQAMAAARVMVVQVVAAVRAIPVEINPAAVAKAVPQSHQRNSLL